MRSIFKKHIQFRRPTIMLMDRILNILPTKDEKIVLLIIIAVLRLTIHQVTSASFEIKNTVRSTETLA